MGCLKILALAEEIDKVRHRFISVRKVKALGRPIVEPQGSPAGFQRETKCGEDRRRGRGEVREVPDRSSALGLSTSSSTGSWIERGLVKERTWGTVQGQKWDDMKAPNKELDGTERREKSGRSSRRSG